MKLFHIEENKSCMCINSTKRVIKKIDIDIIIDHLSELNPLLLPSTHVNPSLTYFREITMIKTIDIFIQSTSVNGLVIFVYIHRLSIEYVTNCPTLDP